MKQVLLREGAVVLEDVPAPLVEPGHVIVQVEWSCISVGTELSGMRASGVPLWKRALQQPENVRKSIQSLSSRGFVGTVLDIRQRMVASRPTGYSAAGRVIAVGGGIVDLNLGDRVACAGAQCAFHAEIISVPRNLTVRVDEAVGLDHASSVTLGAIALQGLRRAAPTLGETFVVIGLGILGQLAVQMLRANGCRVVGTDTDPSRVRLAVELGMEHGLAGDLARDAEQVRRLTGGIGADGVIITAATSSDEVMSLAFAMCRKKGRVVLVGDVGLNLNRSDFYEKELDFLISTSYGPGRYDGNYEENGLDYPVSHVRWTENRNMEEYINLLAAGRVRVAPLLVAVYPLAQAAQAYANLDHGAQRPLTVLLRYEASSAEAGTRHSVPVVKAPQARPGTLGIALVGAGSFARTSHLPNLRRLRDSVRLQTVVSRHGHNAQAAARSFGAARASSDFAEVLADPDVHAVIVATRHNLHASMTLQALQAGKHVLVEKPMALSSEELAAIMDFHADRALAGPILMTGFNRRYSPYVRRVIELVSARTNPMIINYRMNAGYVDPAHWVHGTEGGGRNLGEACHIYDLFTCLTGSRVQRVSAIATRPATGHYLATDNFIASMAFAEGSIATLTYTAMGAADHPKEEMDVYVDGMVISMSDYRSLRVSGASLAGMKTRVPEKGHFEELQAFVKGIEEGRWPCELWQQQQACQIAFEVEKQLVESALPPEQETTASRST